MFQERISRFVESIESLRDFVRLLKPTLEKAKKDVWYDDPKAAMPIVLALFEQQQNPDASQEEKDGIALLKERLFEGQGIGIEIERIEEPEQNGGLKSTTTVSMPGKMGKKTLSFLTAVSKRETQSRLLSENSLISLVSSAEWFLSQILHEYFSKYPEAAGIGKRQICFNDILKFSSFDEAREFLIASQVEDVLRGSFEDWVKFLKEKMNLNLTYLNDAAPNIIEIFQRRNLIIHNGGVVNSIYLQKIPSNSDISVKKGDKIPVSEEYLEAAFDELERFFLLVGFDLWKREAPDDVHRGDQLVSLSFSYLTRERWRVAEAIALFLTKDAKQDERTRMIGQINYWQSLKWRGDFESCRKEIEAADYSAKDSVFQLGKAILLDDDDRVFRLLKTLVESNELDREALLSWPLFRHYRDREDFKGLLPPEEEETEFDRLFQEHMKKFSSLDTDPSAA